MNTISVALSIPLQLTRVEVFERIFYVFLGLGTLVGVIVIAYTLYNAYKYRASAQPERADGGDRPTLGELPTGGGGGKKLFVSFALSAVIVISLLVWTYTMLIYVESGPSELEQEEESITVYVEGFAFGWNFYYDEHQGDLQSSGEMVVPKDTAIRVDVTSTDVWHAFGVPDQRVKADAIPGEHDETWFKAEEEGNYTIECFELCGDGHSSMEATLRVVDQETYEEWREGLEEEAESEEEGNGSEENGDGTDESDSDTDEENGDDSGNESNGDEESDGGDESDENDSDGGDE